MRPQVVIMMGKWRISKSSLISSSTLNGVQVLPNPPQTAAAHQSDTVIQWIKPKCDQYAVLFNPITT